MNGNARFVGVVGALCVLVAASGARANGLVFEDASTPAALAPLQSLVVEAELDDRAAQVTETRRYTLPYDPSASGTRTLRFHRSLPAAADAAVVELQVGGVAQAG